MLSSGAAGAAEQFVGAEHPLGRCAQLGVAARTALLGRCAQVGVASSKSKRCSPLMRQ